MTPDKFKEHMEVCPDWAPPDPRGTFLSLAMAGEAGELANMFKKEWRDGAGIVPVEKITAELFDIGAYAFMLSFHLNVDFVAGVEKALLDFEQRPKYQSLLAAMRKRRAEQT